MSKWSICVVCDGDGTVVNPNIDAMGITNELLADDPDFQDMYVAGKFDIPCKACKGQGKIRKSSQHLFRNVPPMMHHQKVSFRLHLHHCHLHLAYARHPLYHGL